jgi:hypothetical protein
MATFHQFAISPVSPDMPAERRIGWRTAALLVP